MTPLAMPRPPRPGFLALGDSYTVGEGLPAGQAWPHRLRASLHGAPVEPADIDVIAVTGWSADELLAALDLRELACPYALVSLMIGVNDQYRDREVAEHLPYFNTLLSRAVACADGDPSRVFVVSIPDWGVSPFARSDRRDGAAIAAAIDAYNQAQRELCGLRGIAYADITPCSRACGGRADAFVDDGLHPSAGQHGRWLEMIVPVARACLEPPAAGMA